VLLAETVSVGLVPKFPFADEAGVCASDTSTAWPNFPVATAARKMSINELPDTGVTFLDEFDLP